MVSASTVIVVKVGSPSASRTPVDASQIISAPLSVAPVPGQGSISSIAGTTGSGTNPRLTRPPASCARSVSFVFRTAIQMAPSTDFPKSIDVPASEKSSGLASGESGSSGSGSAV